jgi:hypothetical protein
MAKGMKFYLSLTLLNVKYAGIEKEGASSIIESVQLIELYHCL